MLGSAKSRNSVSLRGHYHRMQRKKRLGTEEDEPPWSIRWHRVVPPELRIRPTAFLGARLSITYWFSVGELGMTKLSPGLAKQTLELLVHQSKKRDDVCHEMGQVAHVWSFEF